MSFVGDQHIREFMVDAMTVLVCALQPPDDKDHLLTIGQNASSAAAADILQTGSADWTVGLLSTPNEKLETNFPARYFLPCDILI